MTLYGVKIEKSPLKKKVSKIIVSTTIIHALLPGQIFLPFCFFLSLLFFFLFTHSFYPSFLFFSFFFLYVVVVVVVTYIFL